MSDHRIDIRLTLDIPDTFSETQTRTAMHSMLDKELNHHFGPPPICTRWAPTCAEPLPQVPEEPHPCSPDSVSEYNDPNRPD